MTLQYFVRNYFISILLSFLLCACASRTDLLSTNDLGSLDSSNKLASSMLVGNVDGAKSYLLRPAYELSDDDFKDTLGKALAKRGLLSLATQPPRYIVDATIHFNTPDNMATWNDLTIELDTKYDITLPDHTKIWEKEIHTSDTLPALLDGSVWKNFLLVPASEISHRGFVAADKAIKENVTEFLKAVDQWSSQKEGSIPPI